jgi:hypothetical protein
VPPRRGVPLKPPTKVKRTFYLELGAALALSEIQIEEFRRTGKKPDLSELVGRAIRKLRQTRA